MKLGKDLWNAFVLSTRVHRTIKLYNSVMVDHYYYIGPM